MMSIQKSPNESSKTSESFETSFNPPATPTTKQSGDDYIEIVFDTDGLTSKSAGMTIDQFVSELTNQKDLAAIEEGRKWVAEEFYPNLLSIKSLRLKAGLSQAQLATRINTQQAYISRIENGQELDLRLSTLKKLANALDIELGTIIKIYE